MSLHKLEIFQTYRQNHNSRHYFYYLITGLPCIRSELFIRNTYILLFFQECLNFWKNNYRGKKETFLHGPTCTRSSKQDPDHLKYVWNAFFKTAGPSEPGVQSPPPLWKEGPSEGQYIISWAQTARPGSSEVRMECIFQKCRAVGTGDLITPLPSNILTDPVEHIWVKWIFSPIYIFL